jgi:hypothetical protein
MQHVYTRDRHRAGLPWCPAALPCPALQGRAKFFFKPCPGCPALAALQGRAGQKFLPCSYFFANNDFRDFRANNIGIIGDYNEYHYKVIKMALVTEVTRQIVLMT